jgi:hypothetical protein
MAQFTVVLLLATTLGVKHGGDDVRLVGRWFEQPVRRAVQGAAHRLDSAGCAAVLSDFRDGQGRQLLDRLAERRVDASAYTRSVFFYDGSHEAPCRRPGVYAFTVPGSRVVYACPALGRLALADPEAAQAVIIHEVLHTLGLEQDAPSSQAVTSAVERRCAGR